MLHNEITLALAPLEMTPQQFVTLTILNSRGALSNAELARASYMTPQSANKVVHHLASRQYITHHQDPKHKRILLLRITAKGKAILKRADNAVMKVERRMLADNSLKEQKQLEQLLLASLNGLGVALVPTKK